MGGTSPVPIESWKRVPRPVVESVLRRARDVKGTLEEWRQEEIRTDQMHSPNITALIEWMGEVESYLGRILSTPSATHICQPEVLCRDCGHLLA